MIKRYLYMALGLFCVGMAYIGFIVPGIPFSVFLVIAAWAFAKSDERLHTWLYNHPWFGEFLTNWTEKQIFPTRGKWAMVVVMSSSLAFLWFTTENIKAVMWSGGFMALVAVWAWRFPGSETEWRERVSLDQKIGWFK